MANKKISELVLTENLTDNDVIPVVNSNETKKVAMSSIKEYTKPNEATTEVAGLLSTTDKTKLDGIEEQAQVNKIETIKLNGVEVTPIEKIVDLIISTGSGEGGTTDYSALTNKPKINNVELSGNKTSADLGIVIPTKTSELSNDSGFLTQHQDLTGYAKTSDIPTATSQLTNDSNYIASTVVTAFWKGTQAEYDALGSYNATTLYLIEG